MSSAFFGLWRVRRVRRMTWAKPRLVDLKSASGKPECRFESGRGHHLHFAVGERHRSTGRTGVRRTRARSISWPVTSHAIPVTSSSASWQARARTSPGSIPPGVAGPVSRPWKRIRSAKATEPPHLGQTHLLRGIAAVVADALPGIGRAPAPVCPRRLAPLRARPALGVSVGEQQSHYSDTEQNKTDRAHGSSPSQLFRASPPLRQLRRAASQPLAAIGYGAPDPAAMPAYSLAASRTMRRRAAVFGRERPGEFLSEVRGGTQHGKGLRQSLFDTGRKIPVLTMQQISAFDS
jgi:hypothetical protein